LQPILRVRSTAEVFIFIQRIEEHFSIIFVFSSNVCSLFPPRWEECPYSDLSREPRTKRKHPEKNPRGPCESHNPSKRSSLPFLNQSFCNSLFSTVRPLTAPAFDEKRKSRAPLTTIYPFISKALYLCQIAFSLRSERTVFSKPKSGNHSLPKAE